MRSIDRCTVKRVVQTGPDFVIELVDNLDADAQALLGTSVDADSRTYIPGKDLPLEQTIATMSGILANLGMKVEVASWRNIVPMSGRCICVIRSRNCALPTVKVQPKRVR